MGLLETVANWEEGGILETDGLRTVCETRVREKIMMSMRRMPAALRRVVRGDIPSMVTKI